jgi:hypothetical protein
MAKYLALLLLAFSVALIVGIGVMDATGTLDEIEEEREIAEAYCYQSYGDASVYSANTVGGHGGFHCVANVMGGRGDQHYHEVTDGARQAAVAANQSGASVDWGDVERYKDSTPTGRFLRRTAALLPLALGIVGMVVGAGWFRGRRSDNTDEAEGDA